MTEIRNAIVTGAAGFIGSKLVRRLLHDGARNVIGIDRFSDYYPRFLKEQNLRDINDDRFRLVEADLFDLDISDLAADADVIFHQAGQPGVRPSWGDSFRVYLDDNVRATQHLLEGCRAIAHPPKVVYASSSSVYGDAEEYPVLESTLTRPMSPYGVTKLAAEHLVSLYGENFSLKTVSLRYFTVYGPGQRPDMAFTRLINSALDRKPIDVYGTGEQVRDFTFVDDIVSANIAAATSDIESASVFNVAGGSSVTLNACIDLVEQLTGKRVIRNPLPKSSGDVFRTGGSTELATERLGWRPQISLEQGLLAQIEWVLSQSGSR